MNFFFLCALPNALPVHNDERQREKEAKTVIQVKSLCGSLESVVFIAIVTRLSFKSLIVYYECGDAVSVREIFQKLTFFTRFARREFPEKEFARYKSPRIVAIKSSYHILSHCRLFMFYSHFLVETAMIRWIIILARFACLTAPHRPWTLLIKFSILYDDEQINAKQLKWKIFH